MIGKDDDSWRGENPANCSTQETRFVDYVVSALGYLNSRVGLPASLCIQNEPNHVVGYDSAQYTKVQWVRVTKLLKQKLNAKGWGSVTLLAAEGNDYRVNQNLLEWGLQVVSGSLNNDVGGLATHSYDTPYAPDTEATRDEDRYLGGPYGNFTRWDEAVSQNPNKPIWMTEFCTESGAKLAGNSEIDRAINSARHLAREMVRFPTQYWFWWTGWSKNYNMEALTYGDAWENAPNKTKTYHVLSKLWKTVPAGGSYVRKCTSVEANGTTSARFRDWPVVTPGTTLSDWEVDAVAFRRSDNKTVLLIVNKNTSNIAVTVKGLRTGNGNGTMADVFTTTGSVDNQASTLTLSAGQGNITLPQRSVTIIVVR